MFLKISSTPNGKMLLSFVQEYKDENGNGKAKHKTIQNIGWLDELENQSDDLITHFKNLVK